MPSDTDLIIVGAGIAGLSSALALAQSGLNVVILEARDRVGGRILTHWDNTVNAPIELGAEFIHGCPPEIWELLRKLKVKPKEVSGENWCFVEGKLKPCNFFTDIEKVFEKMDESAPDESFLDFVERCCPRPELDQAKRWATGYVTGFHAADPAEISTHSIIKGARADEEVHADRVFRIPDGYRFLVDYLEGELALAKDSIHLRTVVKEVHWKTGNVKVICERENQSVIYAAPGALITLPLPVLQAAKGEVGSVRFLPELPLSKQHALERLAMGKITRVALRFRERFWDHLRPGRSTKPLSDLRFLFSQERWFPTWWTTMPDKLPIITGWAPFHDAEELSGQSEAFIVDKALQTIASLLSVSTRDVASLFQQSYWHDWGRDPFSRGAYSYVKVGGDTAQHDLGLPLDNTLFFAGEATDVSGHNGTVHGAFASARRVVREIVSGRPGKRGRT